MVKKVHSCLPFKLLFTKVFGNYSPRNKLSILLPFIHTPIDITRHIALSFVRGAEADLNNDDGMKVSGYSSAIKQLITPLNYHIMSKGLPS